MRDTHWKMSVMVAGCALALVVVPGARAQTNLLVTTNLIVLDGVSIEGGTIRMGPTNQYGVPRAALGAETVGGTNGSFRTVISPPGFWSWEQATNGADPVMMMALLADGTLVLYDGTTNLEPRITLEAGGTNGPAIYLDGERLVTEPAVASNYLSSSIAIRAGAGTDALVQGVASAAGSRSVALGLGTTAAGDNQLVLGRYNLVDTNAALIVGGGQGPGSEMNLFSVDWSGVMRASKLAVGGGNLASSGIAAIGPNSYAGPGSVALGYNAGATGMGSIAIGNAKVPQSGAGSIAIGASAVARRSMSVAIGFNAQSHGNNSIAIGNGTIASNDYCSVAIGIQAKALGNASTAIGYESIASGHASMSYGLACEANGYYSSAAGYVTRADGAGQWVGGFYNQPQGSVSNSSLTALLPDDLIFIVGNGTAETNRSNAMTVSMAGDANFMGSVIAGGGQFTGAVLVAPQGDIVMGAYTNGPSL